MILLSGDSDRCLFLLWGLAGLLDGMSCSFFFSLTMASFRLTVATEARLEAKEGLEVVDLGVELNRWLLHLLSMDVRLPLLLFHAAPCLLSQGWMVLREQGLADSAAVSKLLLSLGLLTLERQISCKRWLPYVLSLLRLCCWHAGGLRLLSILLLAEVKLDIISFLARAGRWQAAVSALARC